MIVQQNMQALNANRMLQTSRKRTARTTERLISGYRINRSADDAAGLSMSEKMRKQIRGLTQAGENVEDGISAVQVAEGALVEVLDMLQRMGEISIDAANGVNSETDRSYMQMEMDQISQEIDRIAESTKFNRTYLLNGDVKGTKGYDFSYKMGAVTKPAEATLSVSPQVALEANVTFNSGVPTAEQNNLAKAMAGQGLSISAYDDMNGKQRFAMEMNGSEAKSNYTVISTGDDNKFRITNQAGVLVAEIDLNVKDDITSGYTGTLTAHDLSAAESKSELFSLYDANGNAIPENALVKYFNAVDDAGDGLEARGRSNSRPVYDALGKEVNILKINTPEPRIGVSNDKTNALKVSFHVGADGTSTNTIDINIEPMNSKSLGINGLKVDGTDGTNAAKAVDTISAAVEKIASQRASLGAAQNRLEHTAKNLGNIVENTTASESQIRDADMAKEMVNHSNSSILYQAGQSMLSQANQSNDGVLALLG